MLSVGMIGDNETALVFFDARDDDPPAFDSCPGSPSSVAAQPEGPTECSSGANALAQDDFRSSRSETRSSWSSEQTTSSDGADSSSDGVSERASSGKSARSVSFIKRLLHREDKRWVVSSKAGRKPGAGWMRRLGMASCIGGDEASTSMSFSENGSSRGSAFERVKVRAFRKKVKELSAVYKGQVLKAHDGAILSMKFSPCGHYLASGGEDGVVLVWRVVESSALFDIPKDDSSNVYIKMDENSGMPSICNLSFARSAESACVVIPSGVPELSEEPLHEFIGHSGDILDLTWSHDKHLLSSSTDKTVRLWRVGSERCLKVFRHSNYVTCAQFNPADEKTFISGSIDGKIRIWSIHKCCVIDWVDTREIITAICFNIDGKGVVAGTVVGNCRFYDWSDGNLQLEAVVSLGGKKKKSPLKRVTGFQSCPRNPKELMVTYGDSKIVILDGADIIHKYNGPRGGSCQLSASFTPNGNHIVSVSENSNVYFWSHESRPGLKKTETIWSCERFFSSDTSIAIPWNGTHSPQYAVEPLERKTTEDVNDHFEVSYWKTAATWPEEKLPPAMSARGSASVLDGPEYKFLRSCCGRGPHALGQVIVTAGWDGRIRFFHNFGLPVHRQ